MNKKMMQGLLLATSVALTLGFAGAVWAAEHPMGGMEHPGDTSTQQSAASVPAAQTSVPSAVTSMTGEVLDLSCYMAHGGMGKDHKKCGKACLVGGGPAGLLLSDGSVVVLVENHEKAKAYKMLREFADEQVKVTGASFNKGGIKALSVDSVEKQK